MVEFSDCYFCGSVADDLEQYPVIPPETDPPAERQARVVVCSTCQEKLDRVIEPIVTHFENRATEAGVDSGNANGDASGSERSEVEVPEDDADTHETGDEADDDGEPEDGPEDAADEQNATDTGDDSVDGEAGGGGGPDSYTEEPERDSGEGNTAGTTAPAETTVDTDDRVELPGETQQILQLLGNREFPIDRGEIVAVATNAYGVTRREADAVVDALVERGRLSEDGGTLYRQD